LSRALAHCWAPTLRNETPLEWSGALRGSLQFARSSWSRGRTGLGRLQRRAVT